MNVNPHLELFRVKVAMLMEQYAQRVRVFVAENRLMGATPEALKAQKESELSRWKFNRDGLKKEIKREVAGLVNKIFLTSYLDGLRSKGKARVH